MAVVHPEPQELRPVPQAAEVLLLMPVYNDWDAAGQVLSALDEALSDHEGRVRVLLVDDGSTDRPNAELGRRSFTKLSEIRLLRLRRNLGHQRAIAIGLAHAYDILHPEVVVVMDADGEDRPDDVPRLLRRVGELDQATVVFGERAKRLEPVWFRALYHVYRLIHRVLTGIPVKVGNFSAVPAPCLAGLVSLSELWKHYAAAVFVSRIPYDTLPTRRGPRLAGRSKMRFTQLVTHGLAAISVFGEVVGVRILMISSLLAAALLIVVAAALLPAFFLASPPSRILLVTAAGVLLILWQGITVSAAVLFFILNSRDHYSFIPLRDYHFYVAETSLIHPVELT